MSRLSPIRRKVRSFWRLPFRRQYLFLLTVGLAAYSLVMMKFFVRYARFGRPTTEPAAEVSDRALVSDVQYALRQAARYVPWENKCRHQADQARLLCRLYNLPYRISVGFRKNPQGGIEGHAWTTVGDHFLTGFCLPDEYVIQAVYA